jgi:hypothetical protein
MDGSKEHPKMTAGLDLGDKYSYPSASSTQGAARLWKRICLLPVPRPFCGASPPSASFAPSNRGWGSLTLGEQDATGVWPRGPGGRCS